MGRRRAWKVWVEEEGGEEGRRVERGTRMRLGGR